MSTRLGLTGLLVYYPSIIAVFPDYGHLLMVISGISIAAQLLYIKELLERCCNAEVCTQKISLVWQLDQTGDWESARD